MAGEALALNWVFGFNRDLPGSVINLSDPSRKALFFIAGHVGVIYEPETHRQRFLLGHCNPITCAAVSSDKRFLVTADAGSDSMIIVWDTLKASPIKTFPNAHPKGTIAIDISPDASYFVSISKVESEEEKQVICVWEWTNRAEPLHSLEIVARDVQTSVRFDISNPHLIVSNGRERVIFWSWEEGSLKFYSPPVSSKEIKMHVGQFVNSIYIPHTNMAVSSTVDGDLVLWEQVRNTDKKIKSTDKRILKMVRVHNSCINTLTTIGGYIVTAADDGNVRFFDYQLRIAGWFEDIKSGSILSVSFEAEDQERARAQRETAASALDSSAARRSSGSLVGLGGSNALGGNVADEEFDSPNFVVATRSSLIVGMSGNSFFEMDPSRRRGQLLLQGQEGSSACLAAHPLLPYLAMSGSSGHIQLWDHEAKRLLLVSVFDGMSTSCMQFDREAKYLVTGFSNGHLKFLDGRSLQEVQSFHASKHALTHVSISASGEWVATADSDRCVALFRFCHRDEDDRKPIEWVFIGRYRSHTAPIVGLQFAVDPSDASTRLISMSEDRNLVEYDLQSSSIAGGVTLKYAHRIEDSAIPTCLLWHPYAGASGDESDYGTMVAANDALKLRHLGSQDGISYRVTLGPTFGGPMHRMLALPRFISEASLVAYSATGSNGVVGLMRFPADGDPRSSMGLIAHACPVTDIAASFDGRFVFSAGSADNLVCSFRVNPYAFSPASAASVVASSVSEEQSLNGFIDALDGGREGETYRDLVDFFFYAQVRCQGEETVEPRKLTGVVPLPEIPNIMRAMGFFPTQRDIEDMFMDIKTGGGRNRGAGAPSSQLEPDSSYAISFETFVKLYINYRRVFGVGKANLEEALSRIAGANAGDSSERELPPAVTRSALLQVLKARGDAFTKEELTDCLLILMGGDYGEDGVPDYLDAQTLAEQVLGFESIA